MSKLSGDFRETMSRQHDQRQQQKARRPSTAVPGSINGSFFRFKLVMLGEAAVGKSSLALKFVRKEFKSSQEPTIGAAFLTETVNLDEDTQVLNPMFI